MPVFSVNPIFEFQHESTYSEIGGRSKPARFSRSKPFGKPHADAQSLIGHPLLLEPAHRGDSPAGCTPCPVHAVGAPRRGSDHADRVGGPLNGFFGLRLKPGGPSWRAAHSRPLGPPDATRPGADPRYPRCPSVLPRHRLLLAAVGRRGRKFDATLSWEEGKRSLMADGRLFASSWS